MNRLKISAILLATGMLAAAPVLAQTAQKQRTQDGNSPTTVGPGSQASKQRTDGNSPTTVGPGSMAYKQRTDGASPPMVGPASGAYKQRTQSLSHSDPSTMGFNKQN